MTGLPAGLYQPGDSVLHRLDPRAKLLALFLLLGAVIAADNLLGCAAVLLFVGWIVGLSGLPLGTALGSAARLRWFFLLIFLMNLFFYAPEEAWAVWWVFRPSGKGLVQGALVVFRVFLLLAAGNVLTLTTPPMALTDGMEWLLKPLGRLKIPVGQVAMILSVAIQFIPVLLEETETIRRAQMARGARFDSSRLWEKAGAVLPLVVPVFLAAFQRADELALAMEARGYRPGLPRPRKEERPFRRADWMALSVCVLLCVLAFAPV